MPSNLFGEPVKNGAVLGCSACPLNTRPERKLKGLVRIKDQKAFLWGSFPGPEELQKRYEFAGSAGQLMWKTLQPCGLSRKDFAIQNVVRCCPDNKGELHIPTKREIQCCSVYNDEALLLNAERANVHLVLGDLAGESLLGKAYKKDHPVLWYEPWNAYVVINFHPDYIYGKGGHKAGSEYYTWRDRFRAVRAIMDNPGRWGYVKSRKYKTVRTHAEFDEMERVLEYEKGQKRRVSLDVEDGAVDGKKVMLLAGFGTGHYTGEGEYNVVDWKRWKGECFSVVLDHPESGYEPTHAAEMKERVKKLVEDQSLRKCLQNGPYDKEQFQRQLGARLRGYDYDTQYGTFLRYSFLRSCGLETLTYRFFPEFGDYKEVTDPWNGNFANAPLDRLVLRNGGDLDVTKRLEERFAPQVRYPLMQVYIHAAMTLDKMETRGPRLDWDSWKKAKEIVPKMIQKLDRQLQQITGMPNFNAQAPDQVAWLVYDKLGLESPEEGKRSTNKEVLEYLLAESGNLVLDKIMKRRVLQVIDGTFLDGYANGARLHDGELRTIWWLTGAVTGRLRSGKGDNAEAKGITNFQNMHGNPLLENMLVSDPNWRDALEE